MRNGGIKVTNLEKVRTAFIKESIGKEFSTKEIRDLIKSKYEINDSSIIPSDYCYNRMNIGKLQDSQLLDFHIFEYVKRGIYIFLGEKYPYDGVIHHKSKGSSAELIVGKWDNGERTIYYEKIYENK